MRLDGKKYYTMGIYHFNFSSLYDKFLTFNPYYMEHNITLIILILKPLCYLLRYTRTGLYAIQMNMFWKKKSLKNAMVLLIVFTYKCTLYMYVVGPIISLKSTDHKMLIPLFMYNFSLLSYIASFKKKKFFYDQYDNMLEQITCSILNI